jgi:hypothetical protein
MAIESSRVSSWMVLDVRARAVRHGTILSLAVLQVVERSQTASRLGAQQDRKHGKRRQRRPPGT